MRPVLRLERARKQLRTTHGRVRERIGARVGDLDRNQRIREMREAGLTLAEIARAENLSRQRVHQILDEDPGFDLEAHAISRVRIRRAHQQDALFARFAALAAEAVPCAVCGWWALRPHRGTAPKYGRTCSPDCANAWRVLRYHISSEARLAHMLRTARWAVNHPDEVEPSALRYARRVLNGTADPGEIRHGRWYIKGGAPERLAKRLGMSTTPVIPNHEEDNTE